MDPSDIERVEALWPALAPFLFVPHTEEEYFRLIDIQDALTEHAGEDETHPLASLLEVIGVLTEKYEDEVPPGY